MKQIKKVLSLLAAAVLLCLVPLDSNTLYVKAEEPVTYYVKYIADINEWRFLPGSSWDENGYHRELYYMLLDIKDGDLLVVEGTDSMLTLDLNVRLGNLTINHANALITAKGIDDCYVLRDSFCAVNGDVTNAYVYDNAVCTFNNNVNYLEVTGSYGVSEAVTVGGTVGHVKGVLDDRVFYDVYNVAAGKLSIENGDLETDAQYYSTTPTENTSVNTSTDTAAAATTPAAPADTSEYDDVPKTGESNIILWLLGIAAMCIAGSFFLRKSYK
ncbi:MAG: LPXTG cell wall anchor domain-containing protein [Lachnospiraceae bacterium]